MQTKNNIRKTISKTLAVIFSLVLLSFTLSAQETWVKMVEKSSFHQIAIAMTDGTRPEMAVPATGSPTTGSPLTEPARPETEASLELEEWMLDEDNFFWSIQIEPETETGLEMEDWMISDKHWDVGQ